MTKSVLYYSSNHEGAEFEEKITGILLSTTGLPIISVTQKPVSFGKNICVGDVGLSYINEWRQILIGAKEATTDYLIMAESDYLYPPEYFQFEPQGEDIYQYDNVWVMWLKSNVKGQNTYRRKKRSEGAQYVKREPFIKLLEEYLSQFPEWVRTHEEGNKPRHSPYHRQKLTMFHGEIPCISIKTGNGVGEDTGIEEDSKQYLPHWGYIYDLRLKFL